MHRMLIVPVACEHIAQHVGRAAGHPCTQIHPRRTKNQDHSRRHILAAVLPDAFHHGQRAAVADRKTLTSAACDVEFARSCPVENGVAHQHIASL